jgi:hypothetical protein
MTDDDLLETVRADFAEVRLGVPVGDVMARGNEFHRSRRLLPAAGAGVGVMAVAAGLTFGLGAPGAAPASSSASLAAWTVTTQPGHTVNLTIFNRRLSGPDRRHLSRALRAVGVPALVLTKRPECVSRIAIATLKPVPYRPATRLKHRPFPRAAKGATFRIKLSKVGAGDRVVIVVPKALRYVAVPPRRLPAAGHPVAGHPARSVLRPYVLPAVAVVPSSGACKLAIRVPSHRS